jgi:hypothetical protein
MATGSSKFDRLPYPTAFVTDAEKAAMESDMTVGELVTALSELDPNLLVMIALRPASKMTAAVKLDVPVNSNMIVLAGK